MAYPGLKNLQFSKPGTIFSALYCTSSGKDVLKPFTYISTVFHPSGSTNNWWRSLSAKRLILSSILGQCLGPLPFILPWYIGDCSKPVFNISCTSGLVYVTQQQRCSSVF